MINEKENLERTQFFLVTVIGCLLVSTLWFMFLVRPDQPFAEFYKHLMTAQGPTDFFNLFDGFWRPIPVNTIPWVMYGLFKTFGVPYYLLSAGILFFMSVSLIVIGARALGISYCSQNSIVLIVVTAFGFFSPVTISSSLSQFTTTDICFTLGYVFFSLSMFRFLNCGAIRDNDRYLLFGFIVMALSKDFAIVAFPLFCCLTLFFGRPSLTQVIKSISRNYLFLFLYLLYIVFMLSSQTYYHKLLFGGDYSMVSEGGGNYVDNIIEIASNVFMLPVSIGNTWIYPFNLALREFVFLSVFLFVLKILIPLIAVWSPRKKVFVFNVFAIVFWMFYLSLSKRLFSYYMGPIIIHVLLLSYLAVADVLPRVLDKESKRYSFICIVSFFSLFAIERSAYAFHDLSWHAYMNNYSKVFRGTMAYLSGQFKQFDVSISSESSPIKHRFDFYHNTTRDLILREYGELGGYQFSGGVLSFSILPNSKTTQCAKINYHLYDDDTVVFYKIASINVQEC